MKAKPASFTGTDQALHDVITFERYKRGMNHMEITAGILPEVDERPWAAYAACRDAGPDVFFSDRDRDVEAARRVCSGCAVQQDCLEWATEMRIRYGMWGGLTPRERRRMERRSA